MYHLALKMLLGDRAKFVMLVGGLTFATLLMTQQSAVFCGLLTWTTSHMRNMRAKLWVVDRKVEQANELKALRDTDVNRVRSAPGVAWAVPVYMTIQSAKLADGNFKPVQLVGLDNTTLVGRPPVILQGRLEDVRLPNAVILDELGVKRLSAGRTKPLGLGDTFELNDKEARIVAICRADRHFFGYPYAYATYTQALQFAPKQRKMLSLVLAEPAPGWTLEAAAASIEAETGMKAYTEEELFGPPSGGISGTRASPSPSCPSSSSGSSWARRFPARRSTLSCMRTFATSARSKPWARATACWRACSWCNPSPSASSATGWAR